ncbi:MAG: hypothetical protein ABWK53_12980 [Anaerolineales bacterium]
MKPEERKRFAVMTLAEGEEIAGMWVTKPVPDSGLYKLIAKKRADGRYEWAHFIHRADGRKEVILRGEAENQEQLDNLVEIINRNLRQTFGPAFALEPAAMDVYSLDGKKAPPTVL